MPDDPNKIWRDLLILYIAALVVLIIWAVLMARAFMGVGNAL